MRNYAIGFVLVVVGFFIYSAVSRGSQKVADARHAFFAECDRLDITHLEGEQFLQYVRTQRQDKKQNEDFYADALRELQRRVTQPRSISRDRRSIETIEPQH